MAHTPEELKRIAELEAELADPAFQAALRRQWAPLAQAPMGKLVPIPMDGASGRFFALHTALTDIAMEEVRREEGATFGRSTSRGGGGYIPDVA